MKNLFISILCFLHVSLFAQEKYFNLDFEKINDTIPEDWENFGGQDYLISIDSTIYKSGENSAVIEYHGDEYDFKAWAYTIPAKYQGKKIKLTGYIKTENVENGYAGLWMRIDPSVGFDNMNDRGITGTTDWKKYEIILDLSPSKAEQIVLGGLLVGTGKMWLDDLTITIDGKQLKNFPPKKLLPADLDKEFDKSSNIAFSNLDKQLTDNLELLGKVWGFLKYRHPNIATGEYNWDYELFRLLPNYLKAETPAARDIALVNWIDCLGVVEECKKCKETEGDAVLKPDFSWIYNDNLSLELKQKLLFIDKNRSQGEQYYISTFKKAGNPNFLNEKSYSEMAYPDEGFRLLSLYRYWNMIHYFFPNKDITDKNWHIVLKEYIPRFILAKNELEYEVAALQLIGEIQDTHANLWGGGDKFRETKGNKYPPIHVRFIENKLVIDDYYNPELQEKAGLQIGDVITEINGKSIEKIVKEKLSFYPASNYPTQLRNISGDILQSNDDEILIQYSRDEEVLTTSLQLFNKEDLDIYYWYRKDETSKSFRIIEGNIGYISLANIQYDDPKQISKELLNCKGIVVDIRNYPSAFVVFSLGQFFAKRGSEFVKFTRLNLNNPGEFNFDSPLMVGAGDIAKKKFKGKVVVLVNEITQSSAEYTAMSFRAGENVSIIGSTTAGADGNVSSIILPGGLKTYISGIGVYYPDGTGTQRVGIVPDLEVLPTIQGIKEGRDELLEKAIEIIENNTELKKNKKN